MHRLPLLAALAIGCGSSPPQATSTPMTSNTAPVQPADDGCVHVIPDIEQRAPDASPAPDGDIPDLDGDGDIDVGFVESCSTMGGNCDYHLYASNHGCPRYLGSVEVTRVSSGVSCAEPPKDGVPCVLTASRMMIHGEIYDYLYMFRSGSYVESGVFRKGDPSPHP
jgi:hypothetical protein